MTDDDFLGFFVVDTDSQIICLKKNYKMDIDLTPFD